MLGLKTFQVSLLNWLNFANFGIFFKAKDLEITKCAASQLQKKPDWNNLKFGHNFSDHMLTIDWTASKGWHKPKITPFHNISLHPAAKVLHYAMEVR